MARRGGSGGARAPVGAGRSRRRATEFDRRGSILTGALVGVGVMAAIDEIVFHQLLGWHHFYDRSTPGIGLLSDGLLHTAELIIIVAGFFRLADLRRRQAVAVRSAWAGLVVGMGGFQVFDGVVDHKILRVHQVRYGVDLLAYDIAWIASGGVVLLVGLALLVLSRDERPVGGTRR